MRTSTKVWLIIAASLVLVGGVVFWGVMSMLKWDFTKLSTVKYEMNDYVIREDYKNISIVTDTADIVFMPSENQETSVVCHEQKNMKHSVAVKDGTLVIELVDSRKWYEYIGINFGAPKITVYTPQGEYGTLSAKSSTGDIQVKNISAGTIDLSVSTGKVTVSSVTCKGDVTVGVSTGKAYLTDIQCKSVISSGSTGDISLDNVIATEKFSIKRNTGDVRFDSCDAAEITVETDTGDVSGNLLTDKIFITKTDTGRVDVPETLTGGKCKVETNTGNIKITVN